jgi:hypothetical protein
MELKKKLKTNWLDKRHKDDALRSTEQATSPLCTEVQCEDYCRTAPS